MYADFTVDILFPFVLWTCPIVLWLLLLVVEMFTHSVIVIRLKLICLFPLLISRSFSLNLMFCSISGESALVWICLFVNLWGLISFHSEKLYGKIPSSIASTPFSLFPPFGLLLSHMLDLLFLISCVLSPIGYFPHLCVIFFLVSTLALNRSKSNEVFKKSQCLKFSYF